MTKYLTAAALLGALALTGSGLANAQPAQSKAACFFATDMGNWTAPDDHTMYLKIGSQRVYRLDFANACSAMTGIQPHLITQFHGGDSVCSPLDLDLKVSDGSGFAEGCIVSNMTELTRAQIDALPRKDKP